MPGVRTLVVTAYTESFERVRSLLLGRPEVLLLEAVDELGALTSIRLHRPDVVLLDARATGDRVFRLLRRITALDVSTKVLVLDPDCNEARVAQAVHCGGAGCIPTACNSFEVVRAIQAVHAGEIWASRKILASALRQSAAKAPVAHANGFRDQLSKREYEILEWMRCGMTNKEIARKLGISDMTVKTHAHNIFHKLEVSGRLRLLGLEHRLGARASVVLARESDGDPTSGLRSPRLKPAA